MLTNSHAHSPLQSSSQSKNQSLTILPVVIALCLVVMIGVINQFQQNTIAVQPATADASIFSGERAYQQLQILLAEDRPHSVDSQANRVVEKRLIQQIRNLGYQEQIQEAYTCHNFRSDGQRLGFSRCANVRNIIVHIPGTQTGKGILLSSHYDSVPAAPGASDAGAALASLLEIARLLTLENPARNNITLLFNEGEETGLLGAKAFMEQHPLAKNLQVAINIEARGTTSRGVLFETGEDSAWLIKHYADTTPAPLSSSLFYEIYKVLPNDTDLTVFKQHGLQGINFAHADNEPHYHTPLDKLDNLDVGSLQHHGDNVWGVLEQIKEVDLNDIVLGNLVYTDVLGLVLVQWPESWSLPISILLLVLLIELVFLLRKKAALSFKPFIIGLLQCVMLTGVSMVVAFVVQILVQKISGHQSPWRANALPLQIALWSLILWLALCWAYCFCRRAQVLPLFLALLFWLILFSIAASYWVTGISFLFILPSVAGLFVLATFYFQPSWPLSRLAVPLPMCTAIVFLPVAYFIQVSVGFQFSMLVGLLFSFIAVSLLPILALASASRKQLRHLVMTLAIVPFAAIVMACIQKPYSAFKPQPVNIMYLQYNNNAALAVGAMENKLPDSLQSEFGESLLEPVFPWSTIPYHSVETNFINLPETRLHILSDETDINKRTVSIRFQSELPQSAGLYFAIPASSGLIQIETAGELSYYDNASPVAGDYMVYQCVGETCQQRVFTLSFSNTEALDFIVANVQFGLPETLQKIADKRGEAATQRQNGDQTFVFSTVPL